MIIENLVLTPFVTNCYIIGCEATRQAMVIDPGDAAEVVVNTLQELDLQLTAIVCTHAHIDHAAGVYDLKNVIGAPFYLHPADQPLLDNLVNQGAIFDIEISGIPTVDRPMKQGDTITIGRLIFSVVETPGHSPGSICLIGEGVVFAGDTLFAGSIGRTDLFGGDYRQLMDSIHSQLMILPDDTLVYPGHGPVTTIGDERLGNPFAADFM